MLHLNQLRFISKNIKNQILRKKLHVFLYKIQVVTPLSDVNQKQREDFANEMLVKKENSEIRFDKIFFSDKANFQIACKLPMLYNVTQNFEKRRGHVVVADGANFKNVIS